MGWRVGDEIGIATTSRVGHQGGAVNPSPKRTITAISGNEVTIDSPLDHTHWGGMRNLPGGYSLEMAAEVVNLARSIVIRGDDVDFLTQGAPHYLLGWHGGTFGAEDHDDSVYDVRYVRADNCGQKDLLGRYCFHFHLKKQCPRCVLKGNAVVNSSQGALVIHGTHKSTVEENILWDSITVGVYTEDGNEMNNTISRNVMICSQHELCKFGKNNNNWQGPTKEGGLFLIGMTNHVIENRVAGHEHGMWTPGNSQGLGKGEALGKVCPQFTPFLTWRGNTFHDCNRFGTYPDNQYPRQVLRDDNGYVVGHERQQMVSCNEFKADGSDNGQVCFVDDSVDWHNMFIGQYSSGDISYRRSWSVNNQHQLYWKLSKNMADRVSYHVQDSIFINDPDDPSAWGFMKSYLPGAAHTFRMKNVTYAGSGQENFHGRILGAIQAPQHCGVVNDVLIPTPGYCTVQYLLENVNFAETIEPDFSFGASRGFPMAPSYIAFDDSLNGYGQAMSEHHNGFGQIEECEANVGTLGGGVGCDRSIKIRRLMIWSENMGSIQVQGKGYNVEPVYDDISHGSNAGHLTFADGGGSNQRFNELIRSGGYGIYLVVGETYTITGLQYVSDAYFVFSDSELALASGGTLDDEFVDLTLSMGGTTRSCRASAARDRSFVSARGIAAGAQLDSCSDALRELANEVGVTTTPASTQPTLSTPAWHECPCSENAAFDVRCVDPASDPFGGLGCNMCNLAACRICGVENYPDCVGSPTTTLATTTSNVPAECSCHPNAERDNLCLNPHTDPHSGLGCNVCNIQSCRICGIDGYPDCAQTTTTATTTTESTTTPSPDCACHPNAERDDLCLNPHTDPHSGLGCNVCNIQSCRICGIEGYPDCAQTTTTTSPAETTPTQTTTEEATPDCPCHPNAQRDDLCLNPHTDPHSGLGCNVCSIQSCRICGIDGYPECSTATTTTTTTVSASVSSTSTATTTTPTSECSCHPNAQRDDMCLDPHTDPHSGLGCNVCNVQSCRICGIDGYPDCSILPTTPPTTTTTVSSSSASSATSPTASTPTTSTPTQNNWNVGESSVFEDDFSDFSANWNIEVLPDSHNEEYQYYTDRSENVRIEDGKLIITPLREQYGHRQYTSGRVTSRYAFRYGRIEVVAKAPSGRGLWPAIWLLPRDEVYGSWPGSGEIDIFEGRGQV